MHFLVQITPESLLELVKLHGSSYFLEATDEIFQAFHELCEDDEISDKTINAPESFVCSAYCPRGVEIGNIPELRWYLFCKHMAESDRLPPTLGSLKQHMLRVDLQAQIWGQQKAATQSF